MSKPMTLSQVLRGGRQCDEDGTKIIMSREACCVAADELESQAKRIEELWYRLKAEQSETERHRVRMAKLVALEAEVARLRVDSDSKYQSGCAAALEDVAAYCEWRNEPGLAADIRDLLKGGE